MHARSVVGCALDGDTGEVLQRRLTPDHREIREWLADPPAPVAVTYEAGPTGFGLARALIAGIDCRVAAPSKLQRPAGDRVKTDARDAAHLARLLHLGQIVEVRIPTLAQEAARDLVRAREDYRGDVMTSRHRISKLLLRQGIVYYGGQAWTGKHEMRLRAQRFDSPALMLAYESALDAMVAGVHHRDRLDEAITGDGRGFRIHPGRDAVGLPAWGVDADRIRAGGQDRHRLTGRSIGAYLGLVPCECSSGPARVQGGVTKTGNNHAQPLLVEAAWHHRSTYRPDATCRAAGMPPPWPHVSGGMPPTIGCTPANRRR